MKALLDTNALLWWLAEPSRIPPVTMELLREPETVALFSQVSLLEIQIKAALGKLKMDFPPAQIPLLAEQAGLTPLLLANEAIFMLPKLPGIHRDPFDRLLVCEAIVEGAALVTPDETIPRYPVKVLWRVS